MYIPITFFVSRRLVMGLSPVHAAAAAAAGADDDDDSVSYTHQTGADEEPIRSYQE